MRRYRSKRFGFRSRRRVSRGRYRSVRRYPAKRRYSRRGRRVFVIGQRM
jgi:hypothetical protein